MTSRIQQACMFVQFVQYLYCWLPNVLSWCPWNRQSIAPKSEEDRSISWCQSVSQPATHPPGLSVSQLASRPVSQSVARSLTHSLDRAVGQPSIQSIDRSIDQLIGNRLVSQLASCLSITPRYSNLWTNFTNPCNDGCIFLSPLLDV